MLARTMAMPRLAAYEMRRAVAWLLSGEVRRAIAERDRYARLANNLARDLKSMIGRSSRRFDELFGQVKALEAAQACEMAARLQLTHQHGKRVAELLNANTELVEQRRGARRERDEVLAELDRLHTLRPESEWFEDYGDVLWHHLDEHGRLCEEPFVGHPLSSDWDEDNKDYYTHWSPLPRMTDENTTIIHEKV
jgi:hypothetical protein